MQHMTTLLSTATEDGALITLEALHQASILTYADVC
jgi:hypothetical protein